MNTGETRYLAGWIAAAIFMTALAVIGYVICWPIKRCMDFIACFGKRADNRH